MGAAGEQPDLLRSCYQRCLDIARSHSLRTIAFPCISTGIYGYPQNAAAHVALASVRDWLRTADNAAHIDRIVFVIFMQSDREIYARLLPQYFGVTANMCLLTSNTV